MAEVFVCKTAVHKDSRAVTCHRQFAGTPGYESFVACGFETEDFEAAQAHVDCEGDGHGDHWIESHQNGDPNKPVLRQMHGSDAGGVYVQDYRSRASAVPDG